MDSGQLREIIEKSLACINASRIHTRRDTLRNFSFLWELGDLRVLIRIEDGVFAKAQFEPGIEESWDFTISAPISIWQEFLSPRPRPPYHHIFGLWAREPSFRLEGNREVMMRHSSVVNELMNYVRQPGKISDKRNSNSQNIKPPTIGQEPISAGYWNLEIRGISHRFFVEQVGTGRDLLLLHTAGSDARQFTHLLNEERITNDWHLTTFDLAGHGKTFLPDQMHSREYILTEENYISQVLAICDALELQRPIVLGCSMAGSLCLRLAKNFPDRFGGVIACEAAQRVPSRLNHWLVHPNIDGSQFGPQWIDGLMAPDTPTQHRREVLWCYSQSAPDIFYGDVAFYSGAFSMTDIELSAIDTSKCPVYMLTGAYDYSCTPDMSRRTAEKIPGAHFKEMMDLGHFPMAENPEVFLNYLLPILNELKSKNVR